MDQVKEDMSGQLVKARSQVITEWRLNVGGVAVWGESLLLILMSQ